MEREIPHQVSEILQAHYTVPIYESDMSAEFGHIRERLKWKFAEELLKFVDEHNGAIIGPLHETDERRNDLGFGDRDVQLFHLWAHVETMPEAPYFDFIGGPHHKQKYRTDGKRIIRLPAPTTFLGSPFLLDDSPSIGYASEYERVGDSSVYKYVRMVSL